MTDRDPTSRTGWKHHLRPWNFFAALLLGTIGFLLLAVLVAPAPKSGWFARSLELIASAAKYSGVLLSSALAVYGITNEFKEGPEGAKRLTRAGRRAVFVSLLLAVVTILGTLADSQLQSEKAEQARARTREELEQVYEHTKADLEAKSAAQQQQLEQTYSQTTKSLREGYEASRLALENALKPVESVTLRTAFRFPESMRRILPTGTGYWSSQGGLGGCGRSGSLDSPNPCVFAWRGVSEDFFHPMLSFDARPRTRQIPVGDADYFDDYGLILSLYLSRDPPVSLTVFPCAWEPSPYLGDAVNTGNGVFKIKKARCIPKALFFLNRLPGGYNPDAPENPQIEGVRWQGDPRRLEVAVQFRIDPKTFEKLDKSKFKFQHRPVAGDFFGDSAREPIDLGLLHFPGGASRAEFSSALLSLLARLPLTIMLQIWVNDDPSRTRTVLLTKERDLPRFLESWWKAHSDSSPNPPLRLYHARPTH